MSIEHIENFFYSRASTRIRKRIEDAKLNHSKIYKPDCKQISRIINNRLGKNNRFLICDAVISNHYIDEETKKPIKCGLLETPQLGFTSIKEILWGTDEEIDSYLFDLFELLWEEVTSPDSLYSIDKESYLCDYIPYAKYSTYWNILFSPSNKYPALFYGISEDTIIENIDVERDNALKFLYQKCKKDFSTLFSSFAEKQRSFHKLDKIIKETLLTELYIPMLKKYKPDISSLGLRVRDLINADLSHCASQINEDTFNPYYTVLITASSKYILELEELQSQLV